MPLRLPSLLAISLVLTACASPVATPEKFQTLNEDKYAPINLDIYAGEYVTEQMSNIVRYMRESVIESNLFSDVATGFSRWPLTVHLRYGITSDMDAGEFAGTMVSAATMLIVPAPFTEQHNLGAYIYAGPTPIASYNYTQEVEVTMSLFHDPEEDRKNGAKLLLRKFFDDLRNKQPLPTIREIQKGQAERTRNEEKL